MQCSPQWAQTSPTWADSVCSVTNPNFGGYPTPVFPDNPEQERERKARWDGEKAKTEAIRKLVRKAFGLEPDAAPLPAAVAEEVRDAAQPYVREKRGKPRVDWQALEAARATVALLEQLAFEARERAMRDAAEQDDEEIILMAAL